MSQKFLPEKKKKVCQIPVTFANFCQFLLIYFFVIKHCKHFLAFILGGVGIFFAESLCEMAKNPIFSVGEGIGDENTPGDFFFSLSFAVELSKMQEMDFMRWKMEEMFELGERGASSSSSYCHGTVLSPVILGLGR